MEQSDSGTVQGNPGGLITEHGVATVFNWRPIRWATHESITNALAVIHSPVPVGSSKWINVDADGYVSQQYPRPLFQRTRQSTLPSSPLAGTTNISGKKFSIAAEVISCRGTVYAIGSERSREYNPTTVLVDSTN